MHRLGVLGPDVTEADVFRMMAAFLASTSPLSPERPARDLVCSINLKTVVADRLWRLEADGEPVHRWGEGKGSYDGAENWLQLRRD